MGFDKRSEKDVTLTSISNLLSELLQDGRETVQTSDTVSQKIIIHEGGSETIYADNFGKNGFEATTVVDGTIRDEEEMEYADLDLDTLNEIERLLEDHITEMEKAAKRAN